MKEPIFKEILDGRIKYYGKTEAAYEFAAEEFALRLVEYNQEQSMIAARMQLLDVKLRKERMNIPLTNDDTMRTVDEICQIFREDSENRMKAKQEKETVNRKATSYHAFIEKFIRSRKLPLWEAVKSDKLFFQNGWVPLEDLEGLFKTMREDGLKELEDELDRLGYFEMPRYEESEFKRKNDFWNKVHLLKNWQLIIFSICLLLIGYLYG